MANAEDQPPSPLGPDIMKLAFQEFARLGGRARAKALSKAKRREIAKRAVTVRNQKLSAKERADIASRAGRAGAAARWGKARKVRPRTPESPQESVFAAEREAEDEERPLRVAQPDVPYGSARPNPTKKSRASKHTGKSSPTRRADGPQRPRPRR